MLIRGPFRFLFNIRESNIIRHHTEVILAFRGPFYEMRTIIADLCTEQLTLANDTLLRRFIEPYPSLYSADSPATVEQNRNLALLVVRLQKYFVANQSMPDKISDFAGDRLNGETKSVYSNTDINYELRDYEIEFNSYTNTMGDDQKVQKEISLKIPVHH